jgi:hypothetical protein
MRLAHLLFGIVVIAVLLGVCREPAGRVAVVVFFTAIGEVAFGTTALLALYQTVGAIGHANGVIAHAEAVLATTVVLTLATAIMYAWLFAGVWLLRIAAD